MEPTNVRAENSLSIRCSRRLISAVVVLEKFVLREVFCVFAVALGNILFKYEEEQNGFFSRKLRSLL